MNKCDVERTEQIWTKPNKQIGTLCHICKNLYNEANYIVRQEFINNSNWIRYNQIDKMLQSSENYHQLPSMTAQQVLRMLDKNWLSFFCSIKDWKRYPNKYSGKPSLPKYKDKNGECIAVFTNVNKRINKQGFLKFPKKTNIKLKVKSTIDNDKVRQVRIIPKGYGYTIEVIFDKNIATVKVKPKYIVGIDVGVRNLISIGNNIGEKPIVIKGGIAKSINQLYNKTKAEIQQIYDTTSGIKYSKRLNKLYNKRNRKIKDHFHKVSKLVINYCLQHNIDTIIIGHIKKRKQNCNIGRINNQNFVQIPYMLLHQQLKYKAQESNINFIVQDESHTSICSFLDNEPIEEHEVYVGQRKSRGIFKSTKAYINADINATYNIIKNAIPKAFADGIEGVGLHPVVLTTNSLRRN